MTVRASNMPDSTQFPEQPGEWQIRQLDPDHLHVVFGCPSEPGRTCAVPLAPGALPNGASWDWDGDEVQPSITPSINCVGGCGWHGFLTAGAFQ